MEALQSFLAHPFVAQMGWALLAVILGVLVPAATTSEPFVSRVSRLLVVSAPTGNPFPRCAAGLRVVVTMLAFAAVIELSSIRAIAEPNSAAPFSATTTQPGEVNTPQRSRHFVRENQPGYWRHYVTLVVGPDQMTFQGEPVTQEQLPDRLAAVAHKSETVLCIAVTSENLRPEEVHRRIDPVLRGVQFNHISWIGVHPLGTKDGPFAFTPTSAPTSTQAGGALGDSDITATLVRDPQKAEGAWLRITFSGSTLDDARNDTLANRFKPLLEGEPSLKFDTPKGRPIRLDALVSTGRKRLLGGTVLYLPSKNIFYFWGSDLYSSDTRDKHFYGPFPADALAKLNLKAVTQENTGNLKR